MFGITGQRLRIDLTTLSWEVEKIPREFYKDWLGGRGLNSQVIFNESKGEINKFAHSSQVCFGVGALVGTLSPFSGGTQVSVDCLQDTLEGPLGPMIKYAGFDQIIIKGRAKNSVCLIIDDEKVEFPNADCCEELNTKMTNLEIPKDKDDPFFAVATLGATGNDTINISSLYNIGKVMDSKNLKAIAARGTKPVKIAHPEEFSKLCWDLYSHMKNPYSVQSLKEEGENIPKGIACWSCPVACRTSANRDGNRDSGFHYHLPDINNDESFETKGKRCLVESFGGCHRLASLIKDLDFRNNVYIQLFNQATGFELSQEEVFESIERIINIEEATCADNRRNRSEDSNNW